MTTSDDDSAARMRWSGQRIDRVDAGALPGLDRLTGFVRSVRTPEFHGVTRHEVLAKTALNHVPANARMLPGEFTINPYRGCAHACQYCFALRQYRREIDSRIRPLIAQHGFPDPDRTIEDKFALNGRRGQPATEPTKPTQPTLF